jgi:hypothetical protein
LQVLLVHWPLVQLSPALQTVQVEPFAPQAVALVFALVKQ